MYGVLSYFMSNDFYHKCQKGKWSLVFSDESNEPCLDKAEVLCVEQTKS